MTTDGLTRGMKVADMGKPISVPLVPGVLGRLFNVTGHTIDGKEVIKGGKTHQFTVLRRILFLIPRKRDVRDGHQSY